MWCLKKIISLIKQIESIQILFNTTNFKSLLYKKTKFKNIIKII